MAAVMNNPPVPAPHYKLTVDDYYRMGEAGIFGPEDRVELIEGEVIEMSPIGCFHAGVGSEIPARLMNQLLGRAIGWVQYPIRLSRYSAPQPDFALLRFRADFYKTALPTAADVLLVVEIADTSVRTDREIKAPLYARHAIPEYWLVDIPARCVEVYAQPEDGVYRQIQKLTAGRLTPIAFPEAALDVAGLFQA